MKWVFCAALALMVVCGAGCASQGHEHQAANHPSQGGPGTLRVSGAGVQSMTFTAADLAAMPRRTVKVQDRDGVETTFEGVTVQDVLAKAGMQFGHSLRGPRLKDYLLAESSDGYGVVFALPELSEEFSARTVMVVDKANGQPLAKEEGPFRTIVPDEKRHARWVRGLVSLTVQSPSAK